MHQRAEAADYPAAEAAYYSAPGDTAPGDTDKHKETKRFWYNTSIFHNDNQRPAAQRGGPGCGVPRHGVVPKAFGLCLSGSLAAELGHPRLDWPETLFKFSGWNSACKPPRKRQEQQIEKEKVTATAPTTTKQQIDEFGRGDILAQTFPPLGSHSAYGVPGTIHVSRE